MGIVKKTTLVLALIMTVLLFTACDAKMESDAKEYVGKNYEDVITELNNLGFNNIEQMPIEDLTSEGPLADGYVDSVSVNGNDSFKAGDSFATDSNVTITYHIIKKLTPPVDSEQIQNMSFEKLGEMFMDQGFTNVLTEEVYDLDPDTTKEKHVNEIKINDVDSFTKDDVFPFDANVLVICHYPYEKYDANVKVDFIGNLFLNKYDVDFQIDGKKEKTLPHGEDMDETFCLPEGNHVFTFVNTEDSSVKGEAKIEITSDLEVAYEIICYSDEVSIEEKYIDRKIELADNQLKISCSESSFTGKKYKQVVKLLEKEGFENIQTKPVYDIVWFESDKGKTKSVKINGSSDYRRGDIFEKGAKVVVRYHMLQADDPEIKAAKEAEEKEHKDLVSNVEGKSCADARKYLNEKGYSAEYIFEGTEQSFTGTINDPKLSDKDLNDVGYFVTEIRALDTDQKTITLAINTKSNVERLKKQEEKEKKLSSYINSGDAEGALWARLDKEFTSKGWKMNYHLGQTPVNETTWFLKWEIKVRDPYTGKCTVPCTVEAKVKGPGDNPTVTSFTYY